MEMLNLNVRPLENPVKTIQRMVAKKEFSFPRENQLPVMTSQKKLKLPSQKGLGLSPIIGTWKNQESL